MAITKESIQLKQLYLLSPNHCKECNQELPYRKRKHKFCNNSCAAIFNNKERERNTETNKKVSESLKKRYIEVTLPKLKQEYLQNPNYCKKCNQILQYEQRKQKYCSNACHNKNYKAREEVYKKSSTGLCLFCNKPLYKGLKYCNNLCQNKYAYSVYIDKWLKREIEGGISFGYVSGYVRRYLISLKGEQCWQCGWCEVHPITKNIPIHIDHIDGNCRNNSPENLRLLCPNCHSLTPTFGALNKKGRGIGTMRNP